MKYRVGCVYDHENLIHNTEELLEQTAEIIEADTKNEALKKYIANHPGVEARYNIAVVEEQG